MERTDESFPRVDPSVPLMCYFDPILVIFGSPQWNALTTRIHVTPSIFWESLEQVLRVYWPQCFLRTPVTQDMIVSTGGSWCPSGYYHSNGMIVSIVREIHHMVEWLVSESMVIYYIHLFRDSTWPGGELAKPAALRTEAVSIDPVYQ